MNDYYSDIEIEYNNFLAEQELYDNLISLGASICNESSGLLLIQEDYKETVNKYIDKIATGIQQAWDKFKNKVVEFAAQPVIDNVKDKVESYKDGAVEVEYWHKYHMEKFDAIKLAPFNFDQLKQFDNKTDYLKSAYSGIFVDQNKSLKENIIDQVIDTDDKHTVSSEDINNLFNFVVTGFKEKVTKLETDLKQFNGNVSTLKATANVTSSGEDNTATVQQQTTATNKYQMKPASESAIIYESYNLLLEKEEDNTKTQKATNTETSNGNNNEEKSNIKRITWYLSGNTDVISAKMKILRQRYLDAINILKIAFPKAKEEKKEDKGKQELKMKRELKMKDSVTV